MGTSGRVTHGALHSPLLVIFMTVALLAGSSCSHRVLSQISGNTPLTVSITNKLQLPVNVTTSSPVPASNLSVTVPAGQAVQIPVNIFEALGGVVGPTITVAVGGEVYTFVPTLVQEILGNLLGVSVTFSVCANLQPGLSVTVTVAAKPPTTVCLPPPPSPPPPPTFSPPPPSPSPPPPSPSPPPPSPSPPPPSPSPPPPSPSPPPPTPSGPSPAVSPPSPSPPSPISSPAPPPVNEILVLDLNVTNILQVNFNISLTVTTGGVTFVITAAITPGGSQLITLPAGSQIVSAKITTGSLPPFKTFTLPSTLLQTIQGDLSSTNVAQLQVSICPTNAADVLVTVAASVPALGGAAGVCVTA